MSSCNLVLSRIDYCNSLLAGLPQSLVGKLQRVQNCAARLVVRAPPHQFTSLQYSNISTVCPSELQFPVRLHASASTPLPPPPLLISLTFYICTCLLDLFTPVLTPASSKSYSMSTRRKVIVLSYFGRSVRNSLPLHIEMLQQSTPSSLL